MQSIGQVVRRGHNAAADVPVAFLEQKFQELLHWADGLGDQMTADDRNPDAVIVFQLSPPLCDHCRRRRRRRRRHVRFGRRTGLC